MGRKKPQTPKKGSASAEPPYEHQPDYDYVMPSPGEQTTQLLVDENDPKPFGGASEAIIDTVGATFFGEGPELEAPELSIGVEALAKAVGCRMRHDDWTSDPKSLAVFLISDRARIVAEALGAVLEPIIDNGSKCFAGRLWIASPAFKSGYHVPLVSKDTAGIFEELNANGVGEQASLVFDPNATDLELRLYPRGLCFPDCVQRFVIAEQTFTLDALDKVLNRFYETSIITPDTAMTEQSPWKKPGEYVPRPRVEAFLQGWLKSVLNIAFDDPFKIDFEVPGAEGRCDLLVVRRHPSDANAWINHAILELKILRSRTSGGNAVSSKKRLEAVRDGFLQAVAYKTERKVALGMLCCFDMRLPLHNDGEGCLDPVRMDAEARNIALRRYRLYGSSDHLRAEKYGTLHGAEH